MCKCLFKCMFELIIILLNLPLLLLSIVFIVFGSVAVASFSTLVSWFTGAISGLSPADQNAVNNFLNFLSPYVIGIGVFLIVVGVLLLLLTGLGLCGACCKNVCMMATYSTLMGLIALGALITSIIYLANNSLLTSSLQTELVNVIKNGFDDPDNPARAGNVTGIDANAVAVTFMLRIFQCCGVADYKDFQGSANKWNRTYQYPSILVPKAQVPVMCCRNRYVTSYNSSFSYYIPGEYNIDTACMSNPTAENSFINTPCMQFLTYGSSSVFTWVMFGVSLGLLLIFFIAVVLTCWYKKKGRIDHESHEMSKY